jgi:hypothetical protein
LRIDQVMQVCLKYCTPIAALMFLGATWWTYVWPGGVILHTNPYGEHYKTALAQPADESTSESGDRVATRTNTSTGVRLGVGRPARQDRRTALAGETPAPHGMADARVPHAERN